MKLQDLRAHAVRIVHAVFSPSHNPPSIVCSGSKAVVATWQRIERGHHAVLPKEAETDKAGLSTEKCRATPRLAVRFGCVGLRDSRKESAIVFYRPGNVAVFVRSSERSQIKKWLTVSP